MSTAVIELLKQVSEMPDEKHVRLPVVAALFACSPSSVYRAVKSGRIPAPKKFSPRVAAWSLGELRAALRKAA